jgi:hypothetical protein
MSATTNRRTAKPCLPYPAGKATPLAVTVDDMSVLAVARRLHDEKCLQRENCSRRDNHSLQGFEDSVRKTLGVLVDAHAAQEI